MDPAKVALVSLHVEPLGLLQYKCEPMSFGIYIPALLKLMKCSEHDDILTLKVLGDANEAELQFESKTNGSYLTVLSKLINLDQEKVIIPVCILFKYLVPLVLLCTNRRYKRCHIFIGSGLPMCC